MSNQLFGDNFLLTTKQAAEALGVTSGHLHYQRRKGEGPEFKQTGPATFGYPAGALAAYRAAMPAAVVPVVEEPVEAPELVAARAISKKERGDSAALLTKALLAVMSMQELADLMQVTTRSIDNWETQRGGVSLGNLSKLMEWTRLLVLPVNVAVVNIWSNGTNELLDFLSED